MNINPFSYAVEIEIEVSLNSSESDDKVMGAVRNMLIGVEPVVSLDSGSVQASTSDVNCLRVFYRQINDKLIRRVVRRLLLKNLGTDSTWIYLNKQAAYMGKVAICDNESESPLGPIKMTLRSTKIIELIDWLTLL